MELGEVFERKLSKFLVKKKKHEEIPRNPNYSVFEKKGRIFIIFVVLFSPSIPTHFLLFSERKIFLADISIQPR